MSKDPNQIFAERLTFGDRLADRMAEIGGSWNFIIGFMVFLIGWSILNTIILAANAFDPFPFIFLNLMLSMLAALQAPIIMMSQNRQAAKDRLAARLDYETNLRSEAEIAALTAKVDALAGDLALLVRLQIAGDAGRADQSFDERP
ncbi:DUF1003 domain-containing protein [Rhizobium sp. SSA_523]|uniref:DUF1003 domain-containing protein n=1 Tax=Rhizobium sp. SSA_523 TaxID=2952477 RepID=UPI002090B3E9|nr:DUF1003 domain-containing protein [Rhizobium sp. SSA_523]MCO5734499.1 DUF1003 domain-containing protein [Rhizobium sp. SSA_523]WKC25762.1 DUF1003 domain-containing protein [Rhizobium sp. SSA_523]